MAGLFPLLRLLLFFRTAHRCPCIFARLRNIQKGGNLSAAAAQKAAPPAFLCLQLKLPENIFLSLRGGSTWKSRRTASAGFSF